MKAIAFSPAAAADIDDIWDYTVENWGVPQAIEYTDGIEDACKNLASGIYRGRPVNIRSGYLSYPAGRHLIFFRTTDTCIEIIRILHQSRDVQRHL